MKNTITFGITLLFLATLWSCASKVEQHPLNVEEVSPWCIIGFDALNRTPNQRIAMLKAMGFKKYGYNKGKGDLSEMTKELKIAKENNIEITSIFLWLNAERDSIGKLSALNRELLRNLKQVEYKPTIWVSFSNNFFEALNQEESIELSVEMIQYIKLKADELGCALALYNHHGWFGNPHNQVKILEKLNQDAISIVYNFHHAHNYLDEFPEIVKKIKPYLSFVNLNGVKKEGPQILTIGEGNYEFEMIKRLLDEGYNGPWGILGHIETEDVQKVLKRNIDGLKLMNSKFNIEDKTSILKPNSFSVFIPVLFSFLGVKILNRSYGYV